MPGRTPDEMFAAEEAAKRFALSKQAEKRKTEDSVDTKRAEAVGEAEASAGQELSEPKPVPEWYRDSDIARDRRPIASCTLAHAVAIRGVETRTVALIKLDFKAANLEIRECERGLEISYTGADSKRASLITPWANVVEFRYVK